MIVAEGLTLFPLRRDFFDACKKGCENALIRSSSDDSGGGGGGGETLPATWRVKSSLEGAKASKETLPDTCDRAREEEVSATEAEASSEACEVADLDAESKSEAAAGRDAIFSSNRPQRGRQLSTSTTEIPGTKTPKLSVNFVYRRPEKGATGSAERWLREVCQKRLL